MSGGKLKLRPEEKAKDGKAISVKYIVLCVTPKVPQSNFLSTVIFKFDYVFFFGIYCHLIQTGSSH